MGSVVSPGDVIAVKYVVERVLGEGGMGVVVEATHRELGHRVAIKFLHAEALDNAEIVARFAREARTLARLRSEHVARVIDVGDLDGAQPYIVMEHLQGRDLATLLDEEAPLPIDESVGYVLQAAHAVAEAHASGVVHRDLKPGNLFLADRPDSTRAIKVLDFGIAKQLETQDTKLTRTGSSMGSPSYMAPEQMRNAADADPRSDVWGLGATLFELVTSRVPFRGDTVTEVVAKVLGDPTPSVRALRAECPPELEAVIHKCLEKSPDRRFGSLAQLAEALAPLGPPGSEKLARQIRAMLERGGRGSTTNEAPRAAGADEATFVVGGGRTPAVTARSGSEATDPTQLSQPRAPEVEPQPEERPPAERAPAERTAIGQTLASAPAAGAAPSGVGTRVGAGLAAVLAVAGIGWFATRPPAPPAPSGTQPTAAASTRPTAAAEPPRTAEPSAPSPTEPIVEMASAAPSASADAPPPVASSAPRPVGGPLRPPPTRPTATAPTPTATAKPTATGSLDMGLK